MIRILQGFSGRAARVCRAMVLIVAGAMTLTAAASAQEDVELTAEQQGAIDWAQQRGELLYRYDQAAWHGTDAFLADYQADRDGEFMRGYVVVEGEQGRLDAVFFGDFGAGLVEAARYSVDGGTVVSGTYYDEDSRPPLSAKAIRMAEVRQVAFNAMREEELGLCANSAPNTVVLPPDAAGNIEVYVLTPPTSNDSYPLGGHYRFTIDSDDEVSDWRRFLNSCFALQAGPQQDDNGDPVTPTMLVVSHLLDPQPTEVHFFATHYFGLPVAVITVDNDLVWTIGGGRFQGAFAVTP